MSRMGIKLSTKAIEAGQVVYQKTSFLSEHRKVGDADPGRTEGD